MSRKMAASGFGNTSSAISPIELRHLTIKPTTYCSCNCPYCESRQELFKKSRERVMTVDDWSWVFADADSLGTEYLDISGGEPILYKGIEALIWEAKRLGWFVSLNTSGINVNPNSVSNLARAGLDQIILSVMSLSHQRELDIRKKTKNSASAFDTVKTIKSSAIRVVLHFIMSRQNFRELPDLIDAAFEWEVNSLALVYPENDYSLHYLLMTEDDIAEFRREVLPVATERYARHTSPNDPNLARLSGLFSKHGVDGDFAKGIYWYSLSEVNSACTKPNTFALIYPNGNVLPCNGIEYAHNPIVGNLFNQSLREIWQGSLYESFRAQRIPFCAYCPIKRHTGVGVLTKENPPYTAPVIKNVPSFLTKTRPPTRYVPRGDEKSVEREANEQYTVSS